MQRYRLLVVNSTRDLWWKRRSEALQTHSRGASRHWEQGLQFLDNIQKQGLEPDLLACTAAIGSLGHCQKWQVALDLFGSMLQCEAALDTVAHNAAISACEKGQRWKAAMHLLELMWQGRIARDVTTCNTAISACEKSHKWRGALQLLREAQEQRLVLDVVTYSAATSACEKGHQWQAALRLLAEARRCRAEPNIVTYSAAISAHGNCSRWQGALRLLAQMQGRRVLANAVACNATITACARGQRWQDALALLQDAVHRAHISVSTITCNATIGACEKGMQWKEALRQLASMRHRFYRPNAITYASLLRLFENVGQLGFVSLVHKARDQGRPGRHGEVLAGGVDSSRGGLVSQQMYTTLARWLRRLPSSNIQASSRDLLVHSAEALGCSCVRQVLAVLGLQCRLAEPTALGGKVTGDRAVVPGERCSWRTVQTSGGIQQLPAMHFSVVCSLQLPLPGAPERVLEPVLPR